mmetsp:Transcript_28462/g.92969  ORF Transcript_28462/g.92969 Transcript_28462/m.92969 type:complete len:205 (-) Transcript_28462:567-1181(-)
MDGGTKSGLQHEERLGNLGRDGENLKRFASSERFGGDDARVCDPKIGEVFLRERLPRPFGEDGVRRKGGHLLRTSLGEHALTLDEGATALDHVVHDDAVPPLRVALLQPHLSPLPVAHFGAHNLVPAPAEEPPEPLPRALVRVRDDDVVGILERPELGEQERYAAQEARENAVAKVETLLEGVDVENQQRRGPAAGDWDVGQDA